MCWWIAELTPPRPALDGNGTFIAGEGIVEQVDFTDHLCVYDHTVDHCAFTVCQQIRGAVRHFCCYSGNKGEKPHSCEINMKWICSGSWVLFCDLPICDVELWGPDFTHWQDDFIKLVNWRVPCQIRIRPLLKFQIKVIVTETYPLLTIVLYVGAYKGGSQTTYQEETLCVLLKKRSNKCGWAISLSQNVPQMTIW